jgi:hypothetical protein
VGCRAGQCLRRRRGTARHVGERACKAGGRRMHEVAARLKPRWRHQRHPPAAAAPACPSRASPGSCAAASAHPPGSCCLQAEWAAGSTQENDIAGPKKYSCPPPALVAAHSRVAPQNLAAPAQTPPPPYPPTCTHDHGRPRLL